MAEEKPEWQRIVHAEVGTETHVMNVPEGMIVRTTHMSRTVSMVYVPLVRFEGGKFVTVVSEQMQTAVGLLGLAAKLTT